MKVLVVEPKKKPYAKEIGTDLESLKAEVGGWIQAIFPFNDNVAIVCNEEGKLEGLELNRALRDSIGRIYDIIAGTFLVVGLAQEEFASLTDVQLERYRKLYQTPEDYSALFFRAFE